MSIEELTILKLRRNLDNSDFQAAYESLILDNRHLLTEDDVRLLFKLSLLFLSYGDYSLAKLGYRIALRYSNSYMDYQPLYDISINKGYIPISKFIETAHFDSEQLSKRFFNTFYSAYKDNFKKGSIYLSYGQRSLIEFSESTKSSFVLVAPTSYGKSEIIISKVLLNSNKKICIIVPSKALLAQTKRRLLENPDVTAAVKRVITHPEMYKGTERQFVAVLTQERLLRLLQKNESLSLDLILIDEAHNLLRNDNRATLLAQVLFICVKRNSSAVLNFFTPFIAKAKSLQTPHSDYSLEGRHTTEYLKVERFYYIDFSKDKKMYLYDQFLDKSILTTTTLFKNETTFIESHKAKKNIIYLNRPRDIENFAKTLSATNKPISTDDLQEHLTAISNFLHPDYSLLDCIRAGVVYHHGGMPDVIRLYVENIFSTVPSLQFIVTNSTLLEGVNIPAEKIFILANKIGRRTFTQSQFKNLIGRVCRFSEVFNQDQGNLNMLEPQIYLIKGGYTDKRANLLSFLRSTAKSDIAISDEIENLMLVSEVSELNQDQQKELQSSLQYLENIERNTVKRSNVIYVESEIAKLCFRNNVNDFDIIANEPILKRNLERNPVTDINTAESTMQAIYQIFIKGILIQNDDFSRLENEAARKFYAMILTWRTSGSSYRQMIGKFTRYWKRSNQKLIYVGSKWGEVEFGDDERGKQLYVDLTKKTDAERVNLAILRIKEEQDYVDNTLIKYIEILNDLEILNGDFYERIKYGTSDKSLVCLLRNGFSLDLAKCVMKIEYKAFVEIDLTEDEVKVTKGIVEAMQQNEENPILIFEVTYHVNYDT